MADISCPARPMLGHMHREWLAGVHHCCRPRGLDAAWTRPGLCALTQSKDSVNAVLAPRVGLTVGTLSHQQQRGKHGRAGSRVSCEAGVRGGSCEAVWTDHGQLVIAGLLHDELCDRDRARAVYGIRVCCHDCG